MSYNNLTKAELIEKLKESISLEKYNKQQAILKIKKDALEEQKLVVETLKEQLEMQKNAFESKLQEIEQSKINYSSQAQQQFEVMKGEMEYTSNILSKEYQLAELILEKEKQNNVLFNKLVELYHETIFDNKEEKIIQESKK